ncbi:MAG: rod shape-determining protein RodA [Candidatus Schekmanbacteria bacterium]|nr:MAG: rod shape-determining protein RodA [Candidatus Schekmanbacteria bacterium]
MRGRCLLFKEIISNLEWRILLITILLSLLGIATIYSSSYFPEFYGKDYFLSAQTYWKKQLIWFFLGLVALAIFTLIDYRTIIKYAYVIYFLSLSLLIIVLVIGEVKSGSRRWISLGFFNVQPSEFIKLATIIVLSRFISDIRSGESLSFTEVLYPLALALIPAILIILQPDLGTAISVIVILIFYLFAAGVKRRVFYGGILSAIAGSIVMWFFLEDYQRKRILTLFNPEADPLGSGYNIIQSKIAVGSGGIFGKGFLHGSQGQLKFLPESHTDFIFSVFAEEWGFIGVFFLFALFLSLILFCLKVSLESPDKCGALLSFGISSFLLFQVVVNISMVVGLLPVVGIPLPLFSYGGSSMLSTMASIGIVLSIRGRRFIL